MLLTLPEAEGVSVPVPVTVVLWLGVWLLLPVPDGELLGLAPLLRVLAADGLCEELRLQLLVGDPEAVPLPEAVPEEELVALPVPVGELLSELLLLPEALAVMLPEALSPSVMKRVLSSRCLSLVSKWMRQSRSFLLWTLALRADSRAAFWMPLISLRSFSLERIFSCSDLAISAFLCR